jgi:hypothetical protein
MDRTTSRRGKTLIAATLIAATLAIGGTIATTATIDADPEQVLGAGFREEELEGITSGELTPW